MQLKRIISLFLLLVLTIQVLPLREVGSMLFCNQLQEELPHMVDGPAKSKESCNSHYFTFNEDLQEITSYIGGTLCFSRHQENIYNAHVGEVQTPPPNCIA